MKSRIARVVVVLCLVALATLALGCVAEANGCCPPGPLCGCGPHPPVVCQGHNAIGAAHQGCSSGQCYVSSGCSSCGSSSYGGALYGCSSYGGSLYVRTSSSKGTPCGGASCGQCSARCAMSAVVGGCPGCAHAPLWTAPLPVGGIGARIASRATGKNCITVFVWGIDYKLLDHPDVTVVIEGAKGNVPVELEGKVRVLHGEFELPEGGAYNVVVTVRLPGLPTEVEHFPLMVRAPEREGGSGSKL